jgi:hypothetical protein
VRGMFDPAKAQQITQRLSAGEPMVLICKDHKIGYRTVFRWMDENPSFAADIARARDIGADAIADEAFMIADTGNMDDTNRARLRVETRLKLLAKWNPKRYGDKLQLDADVRLQVELIDATQPAQATLLPQVAQLVKPQEDPC